MLFAAILFATPLSAQVSGVVVDLDGNPLTGANVWWAGTTSGTVTDSDGNFTLARSAKQNTTIIASFVGYVNDTVNVSGKGNVTLVLTDNLLLGEVNIVERKAALLKSRTSAFDVETLNSDELCKAACCNLSEAFETNASVDVAYADAATGAKTIRLLGLSGTYVQLLTENTPGVRGLAQSFGMDYIPGPWMQSIQVSKGTSSVINGYEATTGQINVEYLKPQTQDPISINAMLNSELHAELNVEGGWKIKIQGDEGRDNMEEHEGHNHEGHEHESLYTGIMAHYQNGSLAMDDNHDGFLDMPLNNNLNIANRWFYKHHHYTFQAFVRGLYDARDGGQRHTIHSSSPDSPYLITLRTHRVDGYIKNGIVLDEETGMSLGIIAAASYHDQHNHYGNRLWDASQTNAYLNAIFQNNQEGPEGSRLDNDHRLSAGLSVNYDRYNETLALPAATDFSRQEITPGIFAEYALKVEDMLSLVAGVRADWSSRYGLFFTPRMNVRYTPWEWWTIRASVGLGYRSPNVLADNAFVLPSSRILNFASASFAEQERALNTGLSTTFRIPVGNRELSISGEYYFTNFFNCVVADMDKDANAVHFYNLSDVNGRSFAHNAQAEATMEILRGWTLTAAFRYTDVQQSSTCPDGVIRLRQKPLANRWKGIITTSYQTPLKKWQFDVTAQFNGGGRMPDGFNNYFLNTLGSTQFYESGDGSLHYKWYPQLMAQITKYFRTCSLYLGAENMTNYRQDSPILGAEHPFGDPTAAKASDPAFDASMAWGPITGWKVYLGFRWSLPKPD